MTSVPAFSSKLELDLKLSLWRDKQFDYFLPKGGFDKQRLAWTQLRNPDIFELLYGGGAGGSKTWTGSTFYAFEHLSVQGLRSFVGRNTITNIEKSVLVTLKKVLKAYKVPDEYYKYNAQKHYFEFPKNDSVIEFLDLQYAPSDPFYDDYGSLEYAYGWIEEGQQIHFNAYDTLRTRVGRQYNLLNEYMLPLRKLFVTANPKKNWLMKNFYYPHKYGTLPSTHSFIPVLAKENPLTPQTYLDQLDDIKDPIKRARLRDGVWEYEDAQYALFKYHHIISMFSNSSAPDGDRVITCDPARAGKDRCVIFVWSGLKILAAWIAEKCKVPEIIGKIRELQANYFVPNSNVVIDDNGLGGGVTDFIEGSYPFISTNSAIPNKDGEKLMFSNLRAQCFSVASDMVSCFNVGFSSDFRIGTFGETERTYNREQLEEMLREELEVIEKVSDDDDAKFRITPKEKIKSSIQRSPDFADAFSMRFALIAKTHKSKGKEYKAAIIESVKSDEYDLYKKILSEYNYAI